MWPLEEMPARCLTRDIIQCPASRRSQHQEGTMSKWVSGDSLQRQGDILRPDFKDGSPTYFNITVVNTLSQATSTRLMLVLE